MALSVRLPPGKGPYIEHYLIEADDEGMLSLESSDNKFHSIPALIAHYSQCCDELPVELCLPRIIREARTRQQLSSLALLGQEFWRYPMANPRPGTADEQQAIDHAAEERRDSSESAPLRSAVQSPVFSSLPSSQASSLSSFGSGCSPTQDEPVVLRLAPLQPPSLSTFKSSAPNTPTNETVAWSDGGAPPPGYPPPRAPRPTPPNSLNLSSSNIMSTSGGRETPIGRTPPPPPPRSIKPPSNFSITTTVTFSMTQLTTQQQAGSQVVQYREIERSESPRVTPCQPVSSTPPRLSPRPVVSPVSAGAPAVSPRSISPPQPVSSVLSPISCNTPPFHPAARMSPLSPVTSDSSSSQAPHRRSKRHKESSHYRESDILESPAVYSRSPFSDKASDYEDVWGPDTLLARLKSRCPSTPEDDQQICTNVVQVCNEALRVCNAESQRISNENQQNPSQANAEVKESSSDGMPDLLAARPRPAPRPSLFLPPPPSASPTSPLPPDSPQQTKQSSPFYCEPADAIPRRRLNRINSLRNNRHSDPSALIHWPSPYTSELQTIDSKEELVSTSVDDLSVLRKSGRRISLGKPPTKHKHSKRPISKKLHSHNNWTIDSSWEFIGHEDEGGGGSDTEEQHAEGRTEAMFPSVDQPHDENTGPASQHAPVTTLHHLIALRLPDLRLPEDLSRKSESQTLDERVSAYDNITHSPVNKRINSPVSNRMGAPINSRISSPASTRINSPTSIADNSTQTTCCKDTQAGGGGVGTGGWENGRWQALLEKCDTWRSDEDASFINNNNQAPTGVESVKRGAVRAEGSCTGGAAMIRSYVLQLAADRSTVFSQTIENFIKCTTESRETRPHVVMRNMRQFMSGIKNYLVKHGERDFISHVENQRAKLKANEFLNLDAILEGVLERVVVKPLRPHLHRLFVQEYSASGSIHIMADSIHYARTKPLHHLGIRSKVLPPSEEALEKICCYLHKLQQVDSPLEKLENLLACIATIFKSVQVELGADDLLPLFAWVLVQVGMVSAEMEAEYMWGLLHPSLLSGEAGYYLTTLSSAVHVIKNLRHITNHSSEGKSVLRVVVPDEMNGSIITKTLPTRPHMTTREVSKIIAHKLRITNPQDYALYTLIDGEETLLNENDCPQDLANAPIASGKHYMFAYKRIDAKIAWPISTD